MAIISARKSLLKLPCLTQTKFADITIKTILNTVGSKYSTKQRQYFLNFNICSRSTINSFNSGLIFTTSSLDVKITPPITLLSIAHV